MILRFSLWLTEFISSREENEFVSRTLTIKGQGSEERTIQAGKGVEEEEEEKQTVMKRILLLSSKVNGIFLSVVSGAIKKITGKYYHMEVWEIFS